MQDLFRHLHFDPKLAVRFLAVFTRMEYALKVGGFAKGDETKVDPNWDVLANTINDAFLAIDDANVVEARDYLLNLPPRKQVLIDGEVQFVDQQINLKQARTQQVLRMVRIVRNNLFHGDKYLRDGEQEPGRNERLVSAGLHVLLACSVLEERVRMNFEH